MRVPFAKMHGLGNDFMVVEWPASAPAPTQDLVRSWSDRRLGVGFDQLLLVSEPQGAVDAAYRIFNSDGGEVEQCGNGARCIARFVASRDGGLAAPRKVMLASPGGVIEARLGADGEVSVNLGVPSFAPEALPFRAEREQPTYRLEAAGRSVEFGAVSMGNPHIVLAVESVEDAEVGILGPGLTNHPSFPKGVNVGFVQIVDRASVRLRVHERGVGETLACGTGAAAAVVVGRRWGKLDQRVAVELRGGTLQVEWAGPQTPVWQTGPTATVYEGQIEI